MKPEDMNNERYLAWCHQEFARFAKEYAQQRGLTPQAFECRMEIREVPDNIVKEAHQRNQKQNKKAARIVAQEVCDWVEDGFKKRKLK